MTSRPKSRRKQLNEPLDWRELAAGPALRGLAEVLSTPPEVARERASKRAEIETHATGLPANSETTDEGTPTAGGPPTVGDPPIAEGLEVLVGVTIDSAGLTPTEVRVPTEIAPPSVGVTASVGDSPGFDDLVQHERSPLVDFPPAVGVSPDESVGYSATVGVTPTGQGGSWWVGATGARYESKRVHRVVIAQQSMSLGEERVYQTLWHARASDGVSIESEKSKTFSLGYDRIARLVRLNEKSVRVLIPKLIAKKILEVIAAEDSASRQGRTYRIFSDEEILARQRAANLTNVAKNGRAVEFVWPEQSTMGETPTVGVTRSAVNRAAVRSRGPYPPNLASMVKAIVSSFDEDALQTLWERCIQQVQDPH